MFLILDRLAEDGIAPAVLLFHGAGRLFKIIEHFRLNGRDVGDDRLVLRIHFEYGVAARASDFEKRILFHAVDNTPKARSFAGLQFNGENFEEIQDFPAEE